MLTDNYDSIECARIVLRICRTIRTKCGYIYHMAQAFAYARSVGWNTEEEALTLVMSFLTLTPVQLVKGERWNGVWP